MNVHDIGFLKPIQGNAMPLNYPALLQKTHGAACQSKEQLGAGLKMMLLHASVPKMVILRGKWMIQRWIFPSLDNPKICLASEHLFEKSVARYRRSRQGWWEKHRQRWETHRQESAKKCENKEMAWTATIAHDDKPMDTVSFTSTLYTIVHLCRHSQRKSTRKPPAGRHGPACRKRHGLQGGPPPPQRCSPLRLLRALGSGPAQWGNVAMAHGGPWWPSSQRYLD